MDSNIPEEEPGLQGPPPALQSPVTINAPVPDQPTPPLTNLQRFDQAVATQPKPITGIRRVANSFVRGGIPGLASELLDPSAKRQEYAQSIDNITNRQKIEHAQKSEDLTDAYKNAQMGEMKSREEDRTQRREDADLGRQRQIADSGWQEVAANQPPEMAAPGEQPKWEYAKIEGKTYRRPSEFAKTQQKREGEQANWEALPDNVATALGIPIGQKVDPKKFDSFVRLYEAHNKNEGASPEAQVASRTKTADMTGLKGRDRQVYIATGRIERPAQVSVSMGGGTGHAPGNDAKDIAQAIRDGNQPPDLKGMYRLTAPVRAELARSGYDLTTAQRDWSAIQKHIATLNGTQQERLRQAVTFTYDSLPKIETLYQEWVQVAGSSGLKGFNKANLAVSKQLGGRAGAVAHNLETQINDLTSELGTVYKGGNASTDESLRLAAANLKADWNEETFKRAVDQIRQNLQIRKNSIMNSEPVGVSEGSKYAPKRPPALEAPGGGPQPSGVPGVGQTFNGSKVLKVEKVK
jgi:hypothetical protein